MPETTLATYMYSLCGNKPDDTQNNTSTNKDQQRVIRAVFDGGSGGFDPPQDVADPPPRKFCRTSLGGRL